MAVAVPLTGAAASQKVPFVSTRATSKMIVFLRSLEPSARGARTERLARNEQANVAASVRASAGRVLSSTSTPDTLTVRVTHSEASLLARNPLVSAVDPDVSIPGPSVPTTSLANRGGAASAATLRRDVAAGLCGTAADPQLDPEALTNINAPAAWSQGDTGAGVKVAFLADGIDVTNPDFQRNSEWASAGSPTGSAVISSYQDFSGDGILAPTAGGEAFLDASSIAAQGNETYDLSQYVSAAHPLPAGCDFKIVGVAPGASVMALKVYAQNNYTTGDGFVQAINYAVAQGVQVINESFGGNGIPDGAADIIKNADDAAVAAGVTVVVSTGDAGITSTIGSPATDPNVISVGATTTYRAYAQTTYGGINTPGESGGYIDNNISALSSGGFTQSGTTLDLVAPGDLNDALCSTSNLYSDCAGQNVELSGGTSESSPLTAGAAADVIEAYSSTHNGATPSPAIVKEILTSSATDISAPADQQGAGLLNVGAAVDLAKAFKGTSAPVASAGVLSNTSQIDVSAFPNQTASKSFVLTNPGTTPETVDLSTRQFVANPVTQTGSITLDPTASSTEPTFLSTTGATEVYQTSNFTVAPGTGRVELGADYTDTGQTSVLHVAVFDPNGDLAEFSEPQGQAGFADVQVANPVAGTWTAVYYTLSDTNSAKTAGTTGPVQWQVTTFTAAPAGRLSAASITLGAGRSRSVALRVTIPAGAGDSSQSILIDAGGATTTIPVVVRAQIPFVHGTGSFSGAFAGGNGRAGAPGQTNTYDFTVPKGESNLEVSVLLSQYGGAGNIQGNQVIGFVIDPNGQIAAYDSNYSLSSAFAPIATPYLTLYDAHPIPGQYEVVLEWANLVSGASLTTPFSGEVQFNQVRISSTLPDNASTDVSAKHGKAAGVAVTNDGLAPLTLFTDARLDQESTLPLSDFFGAKQTTALPDSSHTYFVPTDTSSISVATTSTLPATFDLSTYSGDPDLSPVVPSPYVQGSETSSAASLTYTPPSGVGAGLWYLQPAEIGPYGQSGEPTTGTITTTASVVTKAFDPGILSDTGDGVEALDNLAGFNPVTIFPGETVIIPLEVAPAAPVGSTVRGTLWVDDLSTGFALNSAIQGTDPAANQLKGIPYAYTVSN